MRQMFGIVLCLLVNMSVQAADLATVSKEIVGAWRLEFTAPDGVHRSPIVIVGRQGEELAAWYADQGEVQEFKNAKLVDDALQLTIVPQDHQGQVTVTMKAKMAGEGKCEGDAEFTTQGGEKGEWKFTGERMKPAEFQDVSQWNLSFTTPDSQSRQATVTVLNKDGKTYGWYSSDEFEIPAKEVKIDGDRVKLAIEGKMPGGTKVQVTFHGTVTGDQVKGDADYELDGNSGSFAFTGKRK